MQSLIKAIYPPGCVMCDTRTESEFALCGSCWGKTPFIDGLCCDTCGAPLPGSGEGVGRVLCDDCMVIARPWSKGRCALVYKDAARHMVLSFKHGDRTDLARAAGPWMARAGRDIITKDSLLVPVPLHWLRLLKRRYNQSALLARAVADETGAGTLPDGLLRPKRTAALEGYLRDARFATMQDAIRFNPKRRQQIEGRAVVLVDDVITSGATLAASAEACFAAGAKDVCVLGLARVVKDA